MIRIKLRLSEIGDRELIRGTRIVRLSERRLKRQSFDGSVLDQLGLDHVGVMISGERSEAVHAGWVRELSQMELPGSIIVTTKENRLANGCFRRMTEQPGSKRPTIVKKGSVYLSTTQSLRQIPNSRSICHPVIAIFVLDPEANLHHTRQWQRYREDDHARYIAQFRQAHAKGAWLPPLFLITSAPAKSINSNLMLAPYGLEAWWYLDGKTLKVGNSLGNIQTDD